ncbi:uncharacterized protein LOC62_03G003594 [Vanrija pseudolonga]|uniref:BTB domain-containing protein n=1 Tax=Vanrija pseudolonga TaxID=143232 RepID=A0AAF1BPZ4_9TREE|nr:hypothetical protein LOC62_03G003594 [Vanrija pseudolonga]
MANSTHHNMEATFTDNEKWTTGDFELISSDNVRFWVETYELQAAGGAFRDMAGVGNGTKALHFTDSLIETADVLNSFLELITTCSLDSGNLEITVHLVEFLSKYDCEKHKTVLLNSLKACLPLSSPDQSFLSVFTIGAVLDNEELCEFVVEFGSYGSWSADDDDGEVDDSCSFHVEVSIWNSQAMPYDMWRLIPGPYLWALERTYLTCKDDPSALSKTFVQMLKVAKATRNASSSIPLALLNFTLITTHITMPQDDNTDPPTIVDDRRFTSGDFAIISSNNVRFRTHTYNLQYASSVFRDMLSTASGTMEIHLTDSAMEKAATVRRFLQLVTTGDLEEDPNVYTVSTVKLVQFLKKYDCQSMLKVLLRRTMVEFPPQAYATGIYAFMIGAAADDINFCVASMECDLHLKWERDEDADKDGDEAEDQDEDEDDDKDDDDDEDEDEDEEDDEGEEGWKYGTGYCFDPRQLPFRFSSLIPHPYLWALDRAWATSRKDTHKLQVNFKKLIQTAKGELLTCALG